MAIYKRDIVDINLETGNIHRSFLKHSIGYLDQAADHFGIRVLRNGEPVDLTGVTVQGIFMPPQGNPIAITTGNIIEGNVAEVVLPQACYNYDGQFCLSIKLVDATNAITGTMRIVDGMVDNTHASGTVAPTGTVPTYQEILSVYADMVDALADVADYAANFAPAFAAGTANAAGTYVMYEGDLYLLPEGHTANTTWANTTKTQANVGGQLSDLKSAFEGIKDGTVSVTVPASASSGWHDYDFFIPAKSNAVITFSNVTASTVVQFRASSASDGRIVEITVTENGTYTLNNTVDCKYLHIYGGKNMVISAAYDGIYTITGNLQNGVEASKNLYDSHLNYAKCIIGFVPLDITNYPFNKYTEYRIKQIIVNSSGFWLYLVVQTYQNGAWATYDSVEIVTASAPTDKIAIINSKYNRFKIAVNSDAMSAVNQNNLTLSIKPILIDYFRQELVDRISTLENRLVDFAYKDSPKHIINVDVNGNGDYTTIGAAYAAITDSSYDNQYEIRVFPGTYVEANLKPPIYTHTHGLHPGDVVVTSVGYDAGSTVPPVFDLTNTAKISNMTIISNYGYCVHFDNGTGGRYAICRNLYCKKVYNATTLNPEGDAVRNYAWKSITNPSVIGMGMGSNTMRIDFIDCVFENGWIAAHTNANNDSYPDAFILLDGCSFVNAYCEFLVAGQDGTYSTNGQYIAELKNCITPFGGNTVQLSYYENNKPWIISGGGNKNTVIIMNNKTSGGSSDAWKCVETTEKGHIQLASGVSCTKGQWIKYDGSVCNGSEAPFEIFGVALESMSANSGEAVSVWCGNAYPYTATSGEYGIASDGTLSSSASTKIGKVINNIFYRY